MPTSSSFTFDTLFAELGDGPFDDYQSFERALVASFNAHLLEFPPGYRWRDALDWALRREVVRKDGARIVVSLPGDTKIRVPGGAPALRTPGS